MGKTRDLFKKIRGIKGTFLAKMGSIKDRNCRDLTEAEDIKKRWQEHMEELYKIRPWVRSLGLEDPLEKETATHSSIVAWRIPWTEEPGGLQSTGSQRVGHD